MSREDALRKLNSLPAFPCGILAAPLNWPDDQEDETMTEQTTTPQTELFHSYLVDSRKSPIDKSKITTFGNKQGNDLRFFCADLDDPRRTNMETPGCIPGDDAFRITGIRIEARFSKSSIGADFIRTTYLQLSIGDKLMYMLEANILADPALASGYSLPGGCTAAETDLNTNLVAEQTFERAFVICPRQGFEVLMSTSGIVANHLRRIESGEIKELVEIKISLVGTRKAFEPDSIPDELKSMPQDVGWHHNPPEVYCILPPPEDYYPCEGGMQIGGPPPLTDCVQPSCGDQGTPGHQSFLEAFADMLKEYLRTTTYDGKNLSGVSVLAALKACMAEFPMQQDELGNFVIELGEGEALSVLVYGFPLPESDTTTDHETAPPDSKPLWNPTDYLKKKD